MEIEKFNFAYSFCSFGFVGFLHCWSTQYNHFSSREIAEKALFLILGALWGILGDEGKEILINAHKSNPNANS